MHLSKRSMGILILAAVAILSGCASTVPPEKQKEYGLLLSPEESGSNIAEIDGDLTWGFGNHDVLPGQHTVRVSWCRAVNACQDHVYTFEVKAGFAYDFKGDRLIYVYDRFHYDQRSHPVSTISW